MHMHRAGLGLPLKSPGPMPFSVRIIPCIGLISALIAEHDYR